MTDRLHSCKDSPDGRHRGKDALVERHVCRYCHRTAVFLSDQGVDTKWDTGWNTPHPDPDALSDATGWRDEESDINDAASRWANRVMNDALKP